MTLSSQTLAGRRQRRGLKLLRGMNQRLVHEGCLQATRAVIVLNPFSPRPKVVL